MKNSSVLSLLTIILTQIACIALGASNAFATGTDRETISMLRQNGIFDKATKANTIRVEGALRCERPPVNNGEGCILSLLDAKSGREFRLVDANQAQHLFSTGKLRVAVEGIMQDSETIEVKTAQSLSSAVSN